MSEPRQIAPVVFLTGVNQPPEVITEERPTGSFRDYVRPETPEPVFAPDDSRLALREYARGRGQEGLSLVVNEPGAEPLAAVVMHPSFPASDIPEV
jgi:hypothetical protein